MKAWHLRQSSEENKRLPDKSLTKLRRTQELDLIRGLI